MFHFPSILISDAVCDKYAEKINILLQLFVKSLRTLVSRYFQLHKMLCLSFMRPFMRNNFNAHMFFNDSFT